MKATTLSSLSILAVVASAFLIPVSAGAAALALTITGAVAVLLTDYNRPVPALGARAEEISLRCRRSQLAANRLAA